MSREQLADLYKDFVKNYPVVTIEDPFDQDDWDSYAGLTAEGLCQVGAPSLPGAEHVSENVI